MNYEEHKGFHPIYILAALYVASIYLFPFLFFGINGSSSETSGLNAWPLLIPVIFGLINLVVVLLGKNTIGRTQLLNCTVLIKYTLIPFFIIGGLCIAVALLLTFTPVVIMIFVGPTVAITLSVLGWFAIVGSAPYSIAYIVKSCKQGVHGKVLSVIAGILQFFFAADVISVMVLALKEKKCVKITVALLVILILAVLIFATWLIALIASAVVSSM